ncbi:Required for respiratory growth protein 9 mitochondrial [Cytospora paraplurivora]|uniref:Required for respiratory growth protein 9, mitochondrial n=1 Tax=Cytospora paraplurivora TaxID=2898453 RepID=A0AAN9YKZ5_9PEZI
MACSCRTSALRIFVRSLTEVYAPNNTLTRTKAWRDTRRRLPVRATPFGAFSCRQLHASTPARNSAQSESGAVDGVSSSSSSSSETAEQQQQAPTADGSSVQHYEIEAPTTESHDVGNAEYGATLPEDDTLFEIKLRSKNARKKLRKYGTTAVPVQATEGQVVQEVQDIQEAQVIEEPQDAQSLQETQEVENPQGFQWIQKAQEAPEVQEVQAVQKKEPVRVSKVFVDETRGSKKAPRRPLREGWGPKDRSSNEFTREPLPPKEEKRRDTRPAWAIQKEALKAKFPEGWQPRKKLSPDALAGIRALHQQYPEIYTTAALSEKFEISVEAIRRILRTNWEPAPQEEEDRQKRWFNRGLKIWERYAELGREPPRRWREAGVQRKSWNGRRWEEDEEDEDDHKQGVDEERLKRLRAQLKLAKSLM